MVAIKQKVATGQKLWHLWHIDAATQRFVEHNQELWGNWQQGGPQEILCNFDPVCLTHVKLSYLVNVLARQHGAAEGIGFAKPCRPHAGSTQTKR